MKAWLLDADKFVTLNGLEPVTNPISFDKGMIPSPDGLFSPEIFGLSSVDRKNKWSYIDLGRPFISPKAYITLKALNRNFESLINGTKKFRIDDGVLVQDDEGQTGMDFLYKNWDKIKFEKNDSDKRSQRIEVLESNKKNVIFITKYIVQPAFYRDVNLQQTSGNPKIPEINDVYNSILRNVRLIQSANNFDFMTNSLIGKTQQLLVDLYNMIKEKVEGKNGYLRRSVLGKSVDYCSRVVITAVSYDTPNYKSQKVNFRYTGVPLAQCCSMLTPYIIWWTKLYFKGRLEDNKNNFPVKLKDGKIVYVKLEDPGIYFNEDYLDKRLNRWINNPSSRFDKIEVPIKEEEKKKYGIKDTIYLRLSGYNTATTTMQKDENKIERPLTWTDVFFMAAEDVSSDKHVIVTRYPLLDYLGMFITRVTLLSTRNTTPMIINDHLYDNYPVIETDVVGKSLDAYFVDSFKICPLYLSALGGDHDGDQITAKMVFTQEGNEEAERIMMSKTNLISIDGRSIRSIGNEGVQTLFTLTNFK